MLNLSSLRQESESACVGGCLSKWKIVFAALLLVEGLIFAHIVILLKRFTKNRPNSDSLSKFRVISHFGNALSAGVFFATGMLHILPEAIEILSVNESRSVGPTEKTKLSEDGGHQEDENDHEAHENHTATFPWVYLVVLLSFYAVFFLEKIIIPRFMNANSSLSPKNEEDGIEVEARFTGNTSYAGIVGSDNVEGHDSTLEDEARGFRSAEFASGLVHILTLSAHSLFESMVLGLSSEFTTVLNIFIATAVHRWLTAMGISFKLARTLSYMPFLFLICLFSTVIPIGIGLGTSLTSLSARGQSTLFAISAAAFFYIGMFENMVEEFVEHKQWTGRKFLSTLSGAGIIVVVTGILVAFDIHG